MKTIKFRGKNKSGEWLYGDLMHYCGATLILPLQANWYDFVPKKNNPLRLPSSKFEVISNTVCQSTGLTDGNGKAIYEGDIIKEDNLIHQILWIDDASCFCRCNLQDADIRIRISRDEMRYVEVIGNIHDNPELIEKGGEK